MGFFERLSLGLRIIFGGDLPAPAAGAPALPTKIEERVVEKIVEKPVEKIVEKTVEVEKVVEKVRVDPEAGALHLLAILQRDGRLIDFLMEDVSGASDADVGAGARIVHEGCAKALKQYVSLEPVRKESEGAPIVVDKGFDPAAIRLSGNVTGEPPYKGKLAHAGWRATNVKLPERPASVDARIVAPAEVEL